MSEQPNLASPLPKCCPEPRSGNWSLTPLSRGGLTRRSGTGSGYPMVTAANELSRLIVQGWCRGRPRDLPLIHILTQRQLRPEAGKSDRGRIAEDHQRSKIIRNADAANY